MLTICGQTGERGVHIVPDVPRKAPSISNPRPPKSPGDKKVRQTAPTFYLAEWRAFLGYSFRKMADLTGFDIASLKRAEDRAAGRGDIKNKNKGVGIDVIESYAAAFGMTTIEPLRRRPQDPPSEIERFAAAPPEWRADMVRMLSRLPKE